MGTTSQVQTQTQAQAQEVVRALRKVAGKYVGVVDYLEKILESLERDIAETLRETVGVAPEDTIIGRNHPERRLNHIYAGLWYWLEGLEPGIAISLRFAVVTYDRENIYNSVVELKDYIVELGKYYDWRDWGVGK